MKVGCGKRISSVSGICRINEEAGYELVGARP